MSHRYAILFSLLALIGSTPADSSNGGWKMDAPRSRRTPDFEGVWNSSSLTPLERPRELGSKEFMRRKKSRCMRKTAARK
jgi:hypothetical protein